MQLRQWGKVVKKSVQDIDKNHTMAFAASLSYYFVMSLFPALIALSAVVSLLPIPDLFNKIVGVMGRAVPSQGMQIVQTILQDVIRPRSGTLLSLGLLGTLWSASSGFSAMIEALDVAYDIPETRPFWKTRLLAIGLTVLVGGMLTLSILCMSLGPKMIATLAGKVGVESQFLMMWNYLRFGIAFALVVISIEGIYFLAPNVRQDFKASLPGAVFAVVGWLALSFGLGFYFSKFANFNATYGTLGAGIALMVWLYWSSFSVLIGAELNSEIIQEKGNGKLPLKQPPPHEVTPKPADSAQLAA